MIIYTRKNTYPLTRIALMRGMRTRRQQVRLFLRTLAFVAVLIGLVWLATAWMIERTHRIAAIDRAIYAERSDASVSRSLAAFMNKRAVLDKGTRTGYFCEVSEQRDL